MSDDIFHRPNGSIYPLEGNLLLWSDSKQKWIKMNLAPKELVKAALELAEKEKRHWVNYSDGEDDCKELDLYIGRLKIRLDQLES